MSDQSDFDQLARLMDAMHAANDLPVGAVIIPKDYRLASVEEYTDRALRLRGAFLTELIQDFANYFARNVKADKLSHAPIFIDPQNMAAVCPLDWMVGDDEPGHKQHLAKCAPIKLPDWWALCEAHGEQKTQDGIVDFLEDFGGTLAAFDETGAGMSITQILGAFRNATISKKSEHAQTLEDTSVSRSALENIDANASRRVPPKITFHVKPYEGFDMRHVTARVIIRSHNDQPIFTLRVIGMEALVHDIAREFINRVQAAIVEFFAGEDAPAIYVGRFNLAEPRS